MKNNLKQHSVIWLLVAVIFLLDLYLPGNWDVVYGYLLAHIVAMYFREKSDVLLLGIVTTTLTVVTSFIKKDDILSIDLLVSRIPVIFCIWASAFFAIRFILLRERDRVTEGRFEALFKFATNGILVTNREGEILLANPSLERLFGYDNGELVGKRIEVLIPESSRQKHRNYREDYHARPTPRNMGIGMELSGEKKDGSVFPVEVSLSPYQSKGDQFVVAFVLDNTYRKDFETSLLKQKTELAEMSQALRDLNEGLEQKVHDRTRELEQARNNMAAALEKEIELGDLKTRFVSMASHEFRTPLSAILSSASLISTYADKEDTTNIKKHSQRIKNGVNNLNGILGEFLSLGRLEEGKVDVQMEPHDIPILVAEIHSEIKSVFKDGQHLEYTHSGDRSFVTDKNLFRHILVNLLSNASKYSSPGKPIYVFTRISPEGFMLSIRDEGMGIPQSDQKHLFGRFFRASNAANTTQGTGLGLHIVQRYVELLQGQISFESEEGKGTEFTVRI